MDTSRPKTDGKRASVDFTEDEMIEIMFACERRAFDKLDTVRRMVARSKSVELWAGFADDALAVARKASARVGVQPLNGPGL